MKTNLPLLCHTVKKNKKQRLHLHVLGGNSRQEESVFLIGSADDTRADVTDDKHKSFLLMAIFEATPEVDTMATLCLSARIASQRRLQFVSLANTTSPLFFVFL